MVGFKEKFKKEQEDAQKANGNAVVPFKKNTSQPHTSLNEPQNQNSSASKAWDASGMNALENDVIKLVKYSDDYMTNTYNPRAVKFDNTDFQNRIKNMRDSIAKEVEYFKTNAKYFTADELNLAYKALSEWDNKLNGYESRIQNDQKSRENSLNLTNVEAKNPLTGKAMPSLIQNSNSEYTQFGMQRRYPETQKKVEEAQKNAARYLEYEKKFKNNDYDFVSLLEKYPDAKDKLDKIAKLEYNVRNYPEFIAQQKARKPEELWKNIQQAIADGEYNKPRPILLPTAVSWPPKNIEDYFAYIEADYKQKQNELKWAKKDESKYQYLVDSYHYYYGRVLSESKNNSKIVNDGKKRHDEAIKNIDEYVENNMPPAAYATGERDPYIYASVKEAARKENPIGVEIKGLPKEDQDVFYYLLGIGQDQFALDYAAQASNEAYRRSMDEAKTWAGSSAGNAILSTISSIALAPAAAADSETIPNILLDLFGDEPNESYRINPMTGLPKYDTSLATILANSTQGVAEGINNAIGTLPDGIPILGGKGLGDLYSLAVSAAQSYAYGSVFGPTAAGLILGSNAMQTAYDDALARGASYQTAAMQGLAQGVAEGLFEYISIDKLMNASSVESALKTFFKQGGIEASEEALTSIANAITDSMIMGDLSNYDTLVKKYMEDGYEQNGKKVHLSENAAKVQAKKDIIEGIVFDALGGLLTGGVLGDIGRAKTIHEANKNADYFATTLAKYPDSNTYAVYAKEANVDKNDSIEVAKNKLKDWALKEYYKDLQKQYDHQLDALTLESIKASETAARAEQIQTANPEAEVITSASAQAYLNNGLDLKTAQNAGAVLDGIVSGEITAENISNNQIDKLNLLQPNMRSVVAETLGVEIGGVDSKAAARNAFKQTLRQYEQQITTETTSGQVVQNEQASPVTFDAQNEVAPQTISEPSATNEQGITKFKVAPGTIKSPRAVSNNSVATPAVENSMVNQAEPSITETSTVQEAPTRAMQMTEFLNEIDSFSKTRPEDALTISMFDAYNRAKSLDNSVLSPAEFAENYRQANTKAKGKAILSAYNTYLNSMDGTETNTSKSDGKMSFAEFRKQYLKDNKKASPDEVEYAYNRYLNGTTDLDYLTFAEQYRKNHPKATMGEIALAYQNAIEGNAEVKSDKKEYGVIRNEYSDRIGKDIVDALDALGKLFNVRIQFADLEAINKGDNNGLYNLSTKQDILLDINPQKAFITVAGHEIGHHLREHISETAWNNFERYAVKVKGKDAISEKQNIPAYAEESVAREEVACDFIGEMIGDKGLLNDFCEAIKKQEVNKEAARGFINAWKWFKGKFTGTTKKGDTETPALVEKVKAAFGTDIETATEVVKALQTAYNEVTKSDALKKATKTDDVKKDIKVGSKSDAKTAYQNAVKNDAIAPDIAEAIGRNGLAYQDSNGDIAVVAKPNKNGISDLIADTTAWKHSVKTYNEKMLTDEKGNAISGRELTKKTLLQNGFSEIDAELVSKRMDSVMNMLQEEFADFPKLQKNLQKAVTTSLIDNQRVLYSLIKNGEYPVNGELSTTCVNRQAFQHIYEMLLDSGIMKDVVFNSAAIAEVNAILRDYGYLTSCFTCFVDARRSRTQAWAENMVSIWNEAAKAHGAKSAFGFHAKVKNANNTDDNASVIALEAAFNTVDSKSKNKQGNLNLGQGNLNTRINRLMDIVPAAAKLLTVEDIMSADAVTEMRRSGQIGSNIFSLLKSSWGQASPKVVQKFEAYGGDIAKLTFDYIRDITGESISGSTSFVSQAAKEAAIKKLGSNYTDAQLRAEMAKQRKSQAVLATAVRNYLYTIDGLRYQSFSDSDITEIFDKMQFFNDMAANRFPAHEYTKVIADVRIFGMTNAKINGSVIHIIDASLGKENAGLVRLANGQLGYVADDRRNYEKTGKGKNNRAPQSIDNLDMIALMYDPRYAGKIGTVAIGFSHKHIEMMLDDPNIRMIIPYHRSALPSLYAHLTGLTQTIDGKTELVVEDFTDSQKTNIKTIKNANGAIVDRSDLSDAVKKLIEKKRASWTFAEKLLANDGNAKLTADEYKKWCATEHKITHGKEMYTVTFAPMFEDFAGHENYYKVLENYDTYNILTNDPAKLESVTMAYAGDSEATTLDAKQLAEYRGKLESLDLFTEEQIEKYMTWAQQDLFDIIREVMAEEEAYQSKAEENYEPAFKQIKDFLLENYSRATYDEKANAKRIGYQGVLEKFTKEINREHLIWDQDVVYKQDKKVSSKITDAKVNFNRKAYAEQVEDVKNNTHDPNNHIYMGTTPVKLSNLFGLPKIPMLVTSNHVYSIAVSKAQAKQDNRFKHKANYHDLGWDTVKKLPEYIGDPALIIKSNSDSNDATFIVVTDQVDNSGDPIIAIIKPNATGHYMNADIGTAMMLSAYGKENFRDYLAKAKTENRILYVDKKRSLTDRHRTGLRLSNTMLSVDFDNSLSQFREIVKNKFQGTMFANNAGSGAMKFDKKVPSEEQKKTYTDAYGTELETDAQLERAIERDRARAEERAQKANASETLKQVEEVFVEEQKRAADQALEKRRKNAFRAVRKSNSDITELSREELQRRLKETEKRLQAEKLLRSKAQEQTKRTKGVVLDPTGINSFTKKLLQEFETNKPSKEDVAQTAEQIMRRFNEAATIADRLNDYESAQMNIFSYAQSLAQRFIGENVFGENASDISVDEATYLQVQIHNMLFEEFAKMYRKPYMQTYADKVAKRNAEKLAQIREQSRKTKAKAVYDAKIDQQVADTKNFLSYMDRLEKRTVKEVSAYDYAIESLTNQLERLRRKASMENALNKKDLRDRKKEIKHLEAEIRNEKRRLQKFVDRKAKDVAVRAYRRTKDGKYARKALVEWKKNSNIPEELMPEIATTIKRAQEVLEQAEKEVKKPFAKAVKDAGQKLNKFLLSDVANLESFSLKQNRPDNLDAKITMYKGRGENVNSIFFTHLIDPYGNVIDNRSLSDVMLCTDDKGNVDEEAQRLLDTYRYHQHGIDRMSFSERAKKNLYNFLQEHPEYDSTGKKKLSLKEIEYRASQEDPVAMEYVELAKAFAQAKDKPVFGDAEGNAVNANTHRAITRILAESNPWLVEKSNEIDDWWKKFMNAWAVGTVYSQSQYDELMKIYPHYTPTHRVIDKNAKKKHNGKKGGPNVSELMKAKGSTLDLNPMADNFANMVNQIVGAYRLSDLGRNVYESLVEDIDGTFAEYARLSSKTNNAQSAVEKMDEEYSKEGIKEDKSFNVNESFVEWTVMVDGEAVTLNISKDMYSDLLSLTRSTHEQSGEYKAAKKLGKFINAPLKFGATAYSLTFPIRNFIKDTQNAIVDDGFAILWYELRAAAQLANYELARVAKFMSNFLEGKVNDADASRMIRFFDKAENVLSKNNMWQMFKDLGGKSSSEIRNFSGFADSIANDKVMAQFRNKNLVGGGINAIKKTVGAVKSTLGAAGEFTESLVRYAAFMHYIKKHGNTSENRIAAIKRASEVTLDFSRHGGATMQMANAWTPYLNASLQGIVKPIREIKNRTGAEKAHYIKRYILMGVLPTLASVLYAINLLDDEEEEEYRNLTQRERDTYYHFSIGDGKFIKIPKDSHQSQLLGNVVERFALWATDGNPDSELSDYFSDYLETSIIPNFVPPVPVFDTAWIGTLIDVYANKDFAGRAIVPNSLKNKHAWEQYDETTSSFAIWLGDVINVSPKVIDYFIKDNFSSYGSMFIDLTDQSQSGNNVIDWITDAYISNFVVDSAFSAQVTSDYYDMLDLLEKDKESDRSKMSEVEYENSINKKTLSAINSYYKKEIDLLNDEIKKTTDENAIRVYKRAIQHLASEALEFYDKCMSGEIKEPVLYVNYAPYGDDIRNELIRIDKFNSDEYDYSFVPSDNAPKIGDHKNSEEEKATYSDIYVNHYRDIVGNIISSDKYAKASDEEKVKMLESARELVYFYSKRDFANEFGLTSANYDPKTEKNDYDQLMKSGVSFFDTYKIHQKIKEITDGDGKKTIMETDFRTWISQNTSLNENQKKLAVELFGELWTMSPVNSEKYDVLVSKYNFSNETANEIFKNISSIVPEEGKDSASQKQKDQAIVSMNLTNSQKYSALMAYANSDSSRDAIAKAQKKGISADQYVRGKYEISKITSDDKNKDGKPDKDSRKRKIAKYLRTANLSYEAKCYFWQLEYSSETASSWRSFY